MSGRDHKYGYGGKEEQEELGLNWSDFGARNYDASLGRWMNVDPLAEKYFGFSGYVYVGNNPILITDLNGKEWKTDEDKKNGDRIKNKAKTVADSTSEKIKTQEGVVEKINNNKKFSDRKKARKTKRATDKLDRYKSLNRYANKAIEAINTLESDSNYTFSFNKIQGDVGFLTMGDNDNDIVINHTGSHTGNDVHEAFHARQGLAGLMNFPTKANKLKMATHNNKNSGTGIVNEMEAYRVQFALYRNSLPKSSKVIVSPSDIDKSFVLTQHNR